MRLAAFGTLIFALALSVHAQAPAAPTLSAPANNATGVSTSTSLTWNASTGATTYRVQLASDSSFLNIVLDDSTLTGTSASPGALPNNAVFFWHVRAKNTSGVSAYSTRRSFTTVPLPPAVPVLSAPASGATGVVTTSTLSWTASTGAATYRVQVSTDSTFTTTVLNDSTVAVTTRSTGSLAVSTVYYWRVNAKNLGGTSAYSSIRNFTTAAVRVPNVPTFVSPANNATGVQVSLNLIWRKDTTATAYHLQFSSDTNFATFLINDSTLTDTVKAVAGLTTNTAYFWRVSSSNAGGVSAFTTTRRFTTISALPGTPALTAPANNAINVALSSNLTWGVATGATTYHVQVSTDSGFATTLVDDSTLTASPKAVGPLANNTLYYWRVNAKNVFGTSAYSRRSFRTIPLAPIAPVLVTPANNATNVSTSATLTWTASTGATTYRVQLSTDSTFATTVLNDSTPTGTTRAANNLTVSTVYYWRMNAKNGGGTSAFSATQKFTTAAVVFPTTPTLSSPANNATNVSVTGSVVWRKVASAATYQLQVSTDSAFATTFLVNDSTLTDTTKALNLVGGAIYYWHVRAKNAGGTSAYSTRRRFTVQTAIAILPGQLTLNRVSLKSGEVLQFALPRAAFVEITLFDAQGRQRKLVNEMRQAGPQNIALPTDLAGWSVLDFRAGDVHRQITLAP